MVMFSKISLFLAFSAVGVLAAPRPQDAQPTGTVAAVPVPSSTGEVGAGLVAGAGGFINSVPKTGGDGMDLQNGTRSLTSADLDNYKNTFLFTNSQYFGLQQYVYNGLGLAGSKEDFENQYNRAAFAQALGMINPGLFDECLNVYVNIHTHCNTFMLTTLGEMSKFAGDIANAASYFQDSYNELVDALNTMPPVQGGKLDDDTRDRLLGAVSNLKEDLGDAQQVTEKVQKELVQFQTDTASDRGQLQKAIADLTAADPEVENQMANSQHEMDIIRQQIRQSESDMQSAIDNINNGLAYVWIWPIGTIVYLCMKPKWEEQRDAALAAEKAEIEELAMKSAQAASISGVYTGMSNIENALEAVQKWVDQAVDQIGTAAQSFQNMQSDVERLQHDLDRASQEVDGEHYFVKTQFKNQLEDASKMWAEVEKLSNAFRNSPAPQNITTDQAVALQQQAGVGAAFPAPGTKLRRAYNYYY